ncbi:hypothetical protein F5Y14DRAFT_447376 [Nemania sp. NC0429]|nr:hypothetical protein F5Y14DRAFT_447376 [Nemania sp. NC0429]
MDSDSEMPISVAVCNIVVHEMNDNNASVRRNARRIYKNAQRMQAQHEAEQGDQSEDSDSSQDTLVPDYTPMSPRSAVSDASCSSSASQASTEYAADPEVPAEDPAATPAAENARNPIEEEQERPFHCSQCPKAFAKRSVLVRHIGDRHVGCQCYWPGCGTRALTDWDLTAHFWQHQREAVEQGADPVACPWPGCTKSFSRRDTVQRCIKQHNASAPRGR